MPHHEPVRVDDVANVLQRTDDVARLDGHPVRQAVRAEVLPVEVDGSRVAPGNMRERRPECRPSTLRQVDESQASTGVLGHQWTLPISHPDWSPKQTLPIETCVRDGSFGAATSR